METATQYQILKAKRKGIMDRVINFEEFCAALKTSELDRFNDSDTLYELEWRLNKIEPLYEEFHQVATRLEELGYDSDRTEFDRLYFKSVGIARAKIHDSSNECKSY
ncbi:hypothetical protein PYW07_014153 [Mythimna separata]|uniref:Uncharacterized protein n=1 Tax=Mythimna separata TaxID=271217 RepID=A0AAD7Z0R4_MYTSE|nr:hypothetical protein PYW07_014153 [Mythimna separata]